MKKNDILSSLPPDLRARMELAEKDELLIRATEIFTACMDNVQDALMMLATVSWEEAATAEEKEDAVRASAVVMTMMQQVRAVLMIAIPPQIRRTLLTALVNGMSKECSRYDAWLRQILPEAAKTRAAHIAAERKS